MARSKLNPNQVNEDTLEDADGNTKVQVEEASDENKIRFDTAGTERMIIDENGNVGIGTSSPDYTLDVAGNIGVDQYIYHNGDANTLINFTDDGITFKAGGISFIDLDQKASSPHELTFNDGSNNIDLVIKGNGSGAGNPGMKFDASTNRLGINGVGTPDKALHVGGSIKMDGTQPTIFFADGNTEKAEIGINSSDNILIENKTINKHIVFKVNDQGNTKEGFRLDGAVPEVVVNQTSESLVDFRVESDNNTHMLFVDGSADVVGINTSTPGSGLHVAHSISLPVGTLRTSAYTITATDFCIVADCNSSAFTLTLPSATDAMAGRIYTIKRMDSGASGGGNQLTISRNGKNIDNVAGDLVLANLDAVTLQCIGAIGGWIRTGSFLAPI